MECPYTTCSICFLNYNEEKRKPLVLPCSHSFCLDCLQQMEEKVNKLCPCCQVSWQHIKIEDLVFCRQLVPVSTLVKSSSDSICKQHKDYMLSPCNICHRALCTKCVCEKHQESDSQEIHDKICDIEDTYSKIFQELSVINDCETNLSKMYNDFKDNKKLSVFLRSELNEELELLYQSDVALHIEERIRKMKEIIEKKKIPANEAALLMSITKAYAATKDGASETFILNFMKNMNSVSKLHKVASAVKTNSKQDACELNDGKEWILKNTSEFLAATDILTKTRIRPTVVNVKLLNSDSIQALEELLAVLPRVRCEVKLELRGCCWTVADSGRGRSMKIMDLLFKHPPMCSLVEFCGHVYATTVRQLPITLRKVGLVLSRPDDMNAVNQLQTILVQGAVKEIDLTILQTFHIESWALRWQFEGYVKMNLQTGMMSPMFPKRLLSLHFCYINDSHVEWMTRIITKVTLETSFSGVVQKLYLPGTRVTPDAVLGIMRDTGLTCEVHLPPDLTAEDDREEVAVLYRKHKCTIMWDAE